MELLLPTVPHLFERVNAEVAGWTVKPRVTVDAAEKWAKFRVARAALAASGTVTLELALAGVPTVGAYRLSLIEEAVARVMRSREISTIILANLVIGANVVPQFVQRDCTPERLADALVPLVSDTPERRRQVEAFARLDEIMAIGEAKPSSKAAAIVLDLARRGRRDLVAGGALEPVC
jgi:lipid-A-disaccharide synthase